MMPFWINLPPGLVPFLPGCAAFVLALAGTALARGGERWAAVAGAVALLAGLMLAVPVPHGWLFPRGLIDHLVGGAAAGVLAAAAGGTLRGKVRGWVLAGLLGAAAWWLAGAPAGRGEFWRVWFAAVGVCWALRLGGGRVAAGSVVVGLVLLAGGVVAGVGPAWVGMAAVLLGAGLGVAVLRPGAVLSGIGPAVGIVAMELGTGGLARGRVGTIDLVCGLALLAPAARGAVGSVLGRRLGRFREAGGVVGVVAGAVGLAWVGGMMLRR